MSTTRDWLPPSRGAQLAMAKDWTMVMNQYKTTWSIPDTLITGLYALIQTAEDALTTVTQEETRTPVATARCKEAFGALVEKMRDSKRRYFLTPPLVDADYIALGLKPRDTIHTISGIPTAQVTIETFLVGRHELGVRIIYLTGDPHDPANKGYRIWYSVISPGEAVPANPADLKTSFYTKRRKDVIDFGFDASGKTAHFAVQIENEGKKGPWGPLTSALIP